MILRDKKPPSVTSSWFSVYCWACGLYLGVADFPRQTPLEKIKLSFPSTVIFLRIVLVIGSLLWLYTTSGLYFSIFVKNETGILVDCIASVNNSW